MSTISFSSKISYQLLKRLTSVVGSTQLYGSTLYDVSNGGEYRAKIRFMKGTIPADFTTLTTMDSRSADVLVTWQPSANLTIDTTANPVVIESQYVNASASGTAAWFWWAVPDYTSASSTIIQQMIGTIGTSGTDLVLASTTIVSGSPYRFSNLKFGMPTSFTY